MKPDDIALIERLKARGLDDAQRTVIEREMEMIEDGTKPEDAVRQPGKEHPLHRIHRWADQILLQDMQPSMPSPDIRLQSLEELLERDRQREKDGFPKKIRVGRLIKPGRGGKDKVVVVPTTVEEKLIHDSKLDPKSPEGTGGSGEGAEGEVIGEEPVQPKQGAGQGPGQGEAENHEIESSAYDLGRILTEKFELPNLKDKGKKRAFSKYVYDLTDRHRGFGQLLDKKATLKKLVQTNISLGNIDPSRPIDPSGLMIGPKDKIYRILSKEKDYESQAMVFFIRDYSGSMTGKPTELVVSQHVLLYAWLLYQYERQVETRFILHDTTAREVPDFNTYYNSRVAGGTMVASAYKLVNQIVEKENIASDYNIYVFHGTDGDDWDSGGKETIPALTAMLGYTSRVGITIVSSSRTPGGTEVERYLKASKLPFEKPALLKYDVIGPDADESRLIDGIRKLIG
ncbi:MAG: DUF444 family protein [Thermodesulfobacteriota bacterium]